MQTVPEEMLPFMLDPPATRLTSAAESLLACSRRAQEVGLAMPSPETQDFLTRLPRHLALPLLAKVAKNLAVGEDFRELLKHTVNNANAFLAKSVLPSPPSNTFCIMCGSRVPLQWAPLGMHRFVANTFHKCLAEGDQLKGTVPTILTLQANMILMGDIVNYSIF